MERGNKAASERSGALFFLCNADLEIDISIIYGEMCEMYRRAFRPFKRSKKLQCDVHSAITKLCSPRLLFMKLRGLLNGNSAA